MIPAKAIEFKSWPLLEFANTEGYLYVLRIVPAGPMAALAYLVQVVRPETTLHRNYSSPIGEEGSSLRSQSHQHVGPSPKGVTHRSKDAGARSALTLLYEQ